MTVLDCIKSRRSIRRFTDQPVPEELLELLLEAVRYAPSWGNTQCWEIVVVREQAPKEALAALLPPKNPATLAVTHAPLVIAVCGTTHKAGFYQGQPVTKFGDWLLYDLGLASQNLCLAAHSLGLGTVIVGAFDHDQAKAILHLPAGYEVVTLIPVGYPAQAPGAPKRRPVAEFSHSDFFRPR